MDEEIEAARRNSAREVRLRDHVGFQPTMSLVFCINMKTSIFLINLARVHNRKR